MTQPVPKAVHCGCFGTDILDTCLCSDEECFLRSKPTMTAEQREWCLAEIAAVEGWRREDWIAASDADLASAVVNAWQDYCRDKGLM